MDRTRHERMFEDEEEERVSKGIVVDRCHILKGWRGYALLKKHSVGSPKS